MSSAIWTPSRSIWTPWKDRFMAHLMRNNGHLVKNAAGHLAKGCATLYVQARDCEEPNDLVDIWFEDGTITLPYYFSLGSGLCFYVPVGSATSSSPGTIYTPADVTAEDGCETCLAGDPCTCDEYYTVTISGTSMCTSCYSCGSSSRSGTGSFNGTYCLTAYQWGGTGDPVAWKSGWQTGTTTSSYSSSDCTTGGSSDDYFNIYLRNIASTIGGVTYSWRLQVNTNSNRYLFIGGDDAPAIDCDADPPVPPPTLNFSNYKSTCACGGITDNKGAATGGSAIATPCC